MADLLQDKVAQGRKTLVKGPGGVLQEQNPSDLQSLTGQAGLAAPPTDAISAGTLGAGPHTQKMMGSPAQVQSALRIAQDPNQNLATAVRQTQVRQQATDEEKQSQQKSKDLQDLGGIGDRVNQFIENQRQKLATTQVQATQVQVAPQSTVQGLPSDPAQLAQLKDAAKALLANPQDMQALLTVNKSLGRNINSTISPDEVQQLYESSTDTLTRAGADVVANSLQVEDLIHQGGLGYDLPTLSGLVNVPQDQLAKMSIPQLQAAINAEHQAEFSKSAELQQQATSGNLGGAERNEARSLGQEASRTGVRASEADFQRLDQSIQNADQVQFGGKVYQVDQLLRDDTISGIISDYLNAAPGSAIRSQLEKSEPQLVKFMQLNQAVLADASKQLGSGAKQFTDIQKSNQGLATVGNTQLDPELMKSVLPGYGELNASKLDTSKSGFLNQLNTLPPEQQQSYANEANALVQDPATADTKGELGKLTKDQLASLHLEQGANSPKLKSFLENRQKAADLQNTAPDDAEAVISKFTGGAFTSPTQLQDIVDTSRSAQTLGLDGAPDTSEFDRDHDGKVDDSSTLYQTMLRNTPKASLADAASGNVKSYQPAQIPKYQPTNSTDDLIMSRLGPLAKDGELTDSEVKSSGLNEDELYQILDSGKPSKWGSGGREIQDEIAGFQKQHADAELTKFPVDDTSLQKLLSQSPAKTIPAVDLPDGSLSHPEEPLFSSDQTAAVQKEEGPLADTIKSLGDRITELNATPDQARRTDLDSLRSRLNQYQSLLDQLKSREQYMRGHPMFEPSADDPTFGDAAKANPTPAPPESDSSTQYQKTVNAVANESHPGTIAERLKSAAKRYKFR